MTVSGRLGRHYEHVIMSGSHLRIPTNQSETPMRIGNLKKKKNPINHSYAS